MKPLQILPWTLVLSLCAACTNLPADRQPSAPAVQSASAPQSAILQPYFDTLARLAAGDPAQQAAEFGALLAAAEQSRIASNRLRYALALGSAGHPGSNPAEALRLAADLLAGPNDLEPAEIALAGACLREFEARVALAEEIERQREESALRLASRDADADRRVDALAAENRSLRRALAEAERKLEAVAEMERSLLEQQPGPAEEAPPRP